MLVSPKSETCRTEESAHDTRWTNGTDRVRKNPNPTEAGGTGHEHDEKRAGLHCHGKNRERLGNRITTRIQPEANAFCVAVMDRDRRLTGFLRGQTDRPIAPPGFELSNGWRVSQIDIMIPTMHRTYADIKSRWRKASRKYREQNSRLPQLQRLYIFHGCVYACAVTTMEHHACSGPVTDDPIPQAAPSNLRHHSRAAIRFSLHL